MPRHAIAAAFTASMVAGSSVASAAPVLRAADVAIAMMSPTSCDVTMTLTIDGAEEIDHRVDSTRIELIDVIGAQTVGELRIVGRTQSLMLRPAQSVYQIHYRAMLPEVRQFRCPLWLPTVPTDGQSRAVALHVEIPAGASPSDSMPMLVWNERRGEGTLGHLPSFVHVPFTPQGVASGWGISHTMDVLTLVVIASASAFWVWWRRGRR